MEYSDDVQKNGEKISENYNPEDPTTWEGVTWSDEENKRVTGISWAGKELAGNLDLSGCLNLQTLDCSSNQLTVLNLSGCSALQELLCHANNLFNLDLSGCLALQVLKCNENYLNSLDLSGYTALQELDCISNRLTSLNLSGCSNLQVLNCYSNELTNLNVSGCSNLQSLKCYTNQLTSLDLSDCSNLQYLSCHSNKLTSLILGNCPYLEDFYCNGNQLTSLDVSGCSALLLLYCSDNQLTSLNLNGCSNLEMLYCNSNKLTNLDLSDCSNLQYLYCHFNKLTSLDLSHCPMLSGIDCSYNQLTFSSLPVSLPSSVSYDYHPQNKLPIGVEGKIFIGNEIDLSAEAQKEGTETVFTWFNSDEMEITPTLITNGVFAFDQSFKGQTVYCRMTNAALSDLTLETDEVLVDEAVSITSHPQSITVIIGDTAPFSIDVEIIDSEGREVSYQWQVSTDGGDWEDIPGATDTSYTTPAVTFDNNGNRYRCGVIYTKDATSSDPVYSNPATLSVVAEPSISAHPQDTTVTVGATATFTIVAEAPDAAEGGALSYQWQVSTDGGSTWNDITGATGSSYTTPVLSLADNGNQYRCRVTNTKDGVASDPVYSGVAALAVVEVEHLIIFIKPADNDEVNINSGSLVLATIIGDMNEVTSVTIKVDDNEEEPVIPTNNTIYYLLPANLGSDWHTITIKLTNTAGQEIIESVRFYWKSYRRGFGFGRFHFDKEPAEE